MTPWTRAEKLPQLKADIQKINLDRRGDIYTDRRSSPVPPPVPGLIPEHGATTDSGGDTSLRRIRQEVFRRPAGSERDRTDMGGIYVDREKYNENLDYITLFRYFLEPLGVSVDKWSMGVRGRSRTYTFADVFIPYIDILKDRLSTDLGISADDCDAVITAVNRSLETPNLPLPDDVPTFTDIQRIFNRSCIECHGGLGYPPYANYGSSLDLSEDEDPAPMGQFSRFLRSYSAAVSRAADRSDALFRRISTGSEDCPYGRMPCGHPPLSQVDVETIGRWIDGPPRTPSTVGDPHIRTVDGVQYDFHSVGEFVLLKGVGLEVQTRQTPIETSQPIGPNRHTGLKTCVSVNTAVAVRAGSHRISYQPVAGQEVHPDHLQLYVDGEAVEIGEEILLTGGGRIQPTTADGGLQIEALGGSTVVVTPWFWGHGNAWLLNVEVRRARALGGIMGKVGPGNWLPSLPDGTPMGPRPSSLSDRYHALFSTLADAWRVTDATSLFAYDGGKTTDDFTLAAWPGESPKECKIPEHWAGGPPMAGLDPLPEEVAAEICAEVADADRRNECEQDVRATGDTDFVNMYLVMGEVTQNRPPLEPGAVYPADFQQDMGQGVAFHWTPADDPDGDPVQYRLCVWSLDKPFNYHACEVVGDATEWWFEGNEYTELVEGEAYYWKVIAEDLRGRQSATETRQFKVGG